MNFSSYFRNHKILDWYKLSIHKMTKKLDSSKLKELQMTKWVYLKQLFLYLIG